MKRILTAALLLWPTLAAAEDTIYIMPAIPSESTKAAALLYAYRLNGNSMVGFGAMGFGAIDFSNGPISENTPGVVRTIRVKPTPLPVDKPVQKAEQPDLNMDDLREFSRRANYKTDICARHGLHKVMVRGGKSWRCK